MLRRRLCHHQDIIGSHGQVSNLRWHLTLRCEDVGENAATCQVREAIVAFTVARQRSDYPWNGALQNGGSIRASEWKIDSVFFGTESTLKKLCWRVFLFSKMTVTSLLPSAINGAATELSPHMATVQSHSFIMYCYGLRFLLFAVFVHLIKHVDTSQLSRHSSPWYCSICKLNLIGVS